MPIGTSTGEQYEDEMDYLINSGQKGPLQITVRPEPKQVGTTTGGGTDVPRTENNAPAGSVGAPEAIINTDHSVVSGAVASKTNPNEVYVDPHIDPKYHQFIATHELAERDLMAQGAPYGAAHHVATEAERSAVEGAGLNWDEYTKAVDGHLDAISKEKNNNPPPDPHIDPATAVGHHYSAAKQIGEDERTPPLGIMPEPGHGEWPKGIVRTDRGESIDFSSDMPMWKPYTRYKTKTVGREMQDQTAEAESKDWWKFIGEFAGKVPLDKEGWEKWLDAPNVGHGSIEDRQQGETRGQYMLSKLRDYFRSSKIESPTQLNKDIGATGLPGEWPTHVKGFDAKQQLEPSLPGESHVEDRRGENPALQFWRGKLEQIWKDKFNPLAGKDTSVLSKALEGQVGIPGQGVSDYIAKKFEQTPTPQSMAEADKAIPEHGRSPWEALTGQKGPRYQTWPERALREMLDAAVGGFKAPYDAYTGKLDPDSQEATDRLNNLASIMVYGPMPVAKKLVEGTALGSFGGLKGALNHSIREHGFPHGTERMKDYMKAQDMELAGKDLENIYRATGWWKDPVSGHWKFEIDSSKATLNQEQFKYRQPLTFKDLQAMGVFGGPEKLTTKEINELLGSGGYAKPHGVLSDYLNFPELYEIYPWIKDIPVHLQDLGGAIRGQVTYHPHSSGKFHEPHISLDPLLMAAEKKKNNLFETVIHEIQHLIQENEGFRSGTNPQAPANEAINAVMNEINKEGIQSPRGAELNTLLKDMLHAQQNLGFYLYKRNPGEIEARLAAIRSRMSASDKALNSPEATRKFWEELSDYYTPFDLDKLTAEARANTGIIPKPSMSSEGQGRFSPAFWANIEKYARLRRQEQQQNPLINPDQPTVAAGQSLPGPRKNYLAKAPTYPEKPVTQEQQSTFSPWAPSYPPEPKVGLEAKGALQTPQAPIPQRPAQTTPLWPWTDPAAGLPPDIEFPPGHPGLKK